MGLLDEAKKKQEQRTAELKEQRSVTELQRQIEELSAKEQQHLSEIAKLQSTVEVLTEEVKTLTEKGQKDSSLISTQEQKIAQLLAQIEKLNESDIELQKSEENLKNAESMMNDAESKLRSANNTAAHAEAKERSLEQRAASLDKKMADEKQRLEIQADYRYQTYKNSNDKVSTSVLLSFAIYCIVLTVIWGRDHMKVIKTIPQWFLDRADNIVALWDKGKELLNTLFVALSGKLPEAGAKGITIGAAVLIGLVLLAVVGFVILFLISAIRSLIDDCRYDGSARFKTAIGGSVFLACFPISVFIVEVAAELPINVFTVWLALGAVMTGAVLLFLKYKI